MICTASVSDSVPRWMEGKGRGWVTAEYSMLPASTGDRKQRDISRGKQDGRGVEIQRLIGRSLRGVVDFTALGERSVFVDCDVLQADGGTRCAAITGGFVALQLSLAALVEAGTIEAMPLNQSVAAISVGIVGAARSATSTTARTRTPRSTRTSSSRATAVWWRCRRPPSAHRSPARTWTTCCRLPRAASLSFARRRTRRSADCPARRGPGTLGR